MSKESNYRLVYVKWRDILACAGWEPAEEVDTIEVVSVGWLHSDDGETVKIGSTLGEDGEPYGNTAFPKGCIVSITDVLPVTPQGPEAVRAVPSSRRAMGRTTHLP